jgi:endogenous inhibitor of DNA gyrase (YacG/DUF329 family)
MASPRVRCPTCQRELEWTPEALWRPFCSERCKMVDLGAWFAEERSIPADAPEDGAAPESAES